jgi:hypothetical protein
MDGWMDEKCPCGNLPLDRKGGEKLPVASLYQDPGSFLAPGGTTRHFSKTQVEL